MRRTRRAYDGPVFVYDHSFANGGFSITGGFVYRGPSQHHLVGHYVAADYISDNFWTIRQDECTGVFLSEAHGAIQGDLSSFGESSNGEMYCCNLANGRIYRVFEDCSVNPVPVVVDTSSTLMETESVGGATYVWYENSVGDDFCGATVIASTSNSTVACDACWYWVEVSYPDGCAIRSSGAQFAAPSVGMASTPEWPINLFPNPAGQRVRIDWGSARVSTLRVHDMAGRLVFASDISAGANGHDLEVGNWPAGCYTVQLQGAAETGAKQFTIQRPE